MNKKIFNYPLYLVTDELTPLDQLSTILYQALCGGVSIVQIRCKSKDRDFCLQKAVTVKQTVDRFNQKNQGRYVPVIVNDHLDIALEIDADGLHLGQSDSSVLLARKKLGSNKIIGLTVNTKAQLLRAQLLPVDYLGVGTIFKTTTKLDAGHEWGVLALADAVTQSQIPLVAIGGIGVNNISQVAQTGIDSIAVVSAIFSAKSPKIQAKELLLRIKESD